MKQTTPALRPVEGHVRALCCECGEVRLMKARPRGRGRNHLPERLTEPKDLAERQAVGKDLHLQPYWRMLIDLRCSNCGTVRRHAWLRDHDPYADYAESLNGVSAVDV